MRSRLLSGAEIRAAAQLGNAAERNGWMIYPHVKLSDVINERPASINPETWSYARRAHFDFVVVDQETRPVFAAEIDGLSHADPSAQRRDRMKDRLVHASDFELLRIGVDQLGVGPRGRRLIEYLVDARQFLEAAEASGVVDSDRDFDPDYRNIVGRDDRGRLSLVNHLSEPSRLRAIELFEHGAIPACVIHTVHFDWRSGWSEAWAWLQVGDDLWLFEKAQVRSFRLFRCGIAPFEIACDLAASAVGEALGRFIAGEPAPVRAAQMQRDLDTVLIRRHRIVSTFHLDRCRFV